MKYAKMLGLLAVAAAALMAFAGTAPATELTSPKGTKLGVGTKIKVETEAGITLDGTVKIVCERAWGEGEITNAGGPGTAVSGLPNLVNYAGCGNNTVTVVKTGSAEIQSLGSNTGTIFSSGVEVTVLTHNILGTIHCIYITNNTHIGTARGSEHAGNTTATLPIASAPIPQALTDGVCKNDAVLTGNAIATTPDHIYID